MSETEDLRGVILETMHNEHCSYKSSRRYLAGLPTTGEHVVQGPGENAGIVRLGDGYVATLRIESHNHPSAIEPFQGAATGIGGIIRDIFTMGSKPIAAFDMLRFGTDAKANWLLDGVTRGISYYGNTVGVPVVGGEVYFDPTYNGNPLVNVACIGLVKEKDIIYGHALTPGNDLIYVGARTGMDGVGGSSFASKKIEEGNEEDRHAVQKGDPYLEKLLIDACRELVGTGWIEGMQDMGAAGVLCSTTEPLHRGQLRTGQPIGARIYIDRVPTSIPNMLKRNILTSESQERMMVISKRRYRSQVLEKFKKWDLEAAVVGEVTMDGNYTLEFHEDGIRKEFTMTVDEICGDVYDDHWPLDKWKTQGGEYSKASTATTDRIWQTYDWAVGSRTIKGPNEPGHYAVLDIKEIGKELVVSWSSDEGRSDLDPAYGIDYAFGKAYRRLEEQGAIPLGLTNCLNFGHPEVSMGAFAQTTRELARLCKGFNVPVVSGNVSLYNGVGDHSIKPTPVIMMVGIRGKK